MQRFFRIVPGLLLLWGCGESGGTRRALPPGVRVDSYTQVGAERVDVLWVLDNSESMAPRLNAVAASTRDFFSVFSQTGVDYRIGITTMDVFGNKGALVGSPRVLSPSTPNPQTAFASNVSTAINVGATAGSPFEAGLDAARRALQLQADANAPQTAALNDCRSRCQPGSSKVVCDDDCFRANEVPFLRPNAYLFIVFVSDEDDVSTGDLRYFWRTFETIQGRGNDAAVTTAAVVGPREDVCSGVESGNRYLDLSTLTGGEVGNICDENFAPSLERLAANAVGLKRKFALSLPPNPDTFQIYVRYPCNVATAILESGCSAVDRSFCSSETSTDVALYCQPPAGGENGWRYEAENGLIYFAGTSVPYPGADIEIQYYEEGKSP